MTKKQNKLNPLIIFGIIGIIFMFYTVSVGNLVAMLAALLYNTAVGAYLLSTGIETKNWRKSIIGTMTIIATLTSVVLVIVVVGMMSLSTILPAVDVAVSSVVTAMQAIVTLVCFLMGW
jgi:uncharacterized membrane protein